MLKKLPITLIVLFMIPALTILAGAIPVGPNIRISDTGSDDAFEPSLAVLGDTVYAVWSDERDFLTHDVNGAIYFAKSTDGGQTWGANVRVTRPDYDKWADDPQIAVQPNGTIWVVWYQLRSTSGKVNDLRLAFSTDGGETFSNEFILVNGLNDAETLWRPELAADENGLYTLYRDYSCAAPCNSNSQDGYTISLSVLDVANVDSSTIIVSDDLFAGRFTNGGLDNGPAVNLTLRNGTICAAWEDYRDRFAVYGACSSDNGETFGDNFRISGADAVNPKIALAPDGTLFATYSVDSDSQNNIIITHSADMGQSWSTPIQITNQEVFGVEDWDFAIDETGKLLLSWVVVSGAFTTDLYLSTSIDAGASWSLIQVEDDQGEFSSVSDHRDPDMIQASVGGSNYAYLAWSDDRNTDDEIWFSRFLLDGGPTAGLNNQIYLPAILR